MADAGGFEPPTARFVAEYSIQLSYASGEYALRQVLQILVTKKPAFAGLNGGRGRI